MKEFRILCTGGSGFIGTHMVETYIENNAEFINIDIAEPKIKNHNPFWRECNILDLDCLGKLFQEFQPTHVIHLAARATTEGKNLNDFQDNILGTANLLKAIQATPSISRVVITSSQHVRKPGSGLPGSDEDFVPHGLYGQSKVLTEQFTRTANLQCTWTIIRPTTVWGPWHPFLPSGLWKLMKKNMYFHPKNDPIIRSYGYVKNVVWQINKLLQAPANLVNSKVFYVGDEPIKQSVWIDAFSNALTGHTANKIPQEWIHLLAKMGDTLETVGIRFPMNSPRYFNLTTTNPVPLEPIIDLFGQPPFSLDAGIKETTLWLYPKHVGEKSLQPPISQGDK